VSSTQKQPPKKETASLADNSYGQSAQVGKGTERPEDIAFKIALFPAFIVQEVPSHSG